MYDIKACRKTIIIFRLNSKSKVKRQTSNYLSKFPCEYALNKGDIKRTCVTIKFTFY